MLTQTGSTLIQRAFAGAAAWWTYAAVSTSVVLLGPTVLRAPSLELQKPPAVSVLVAIWLTLALIGTVVALLVARSRASFLETKARASAVVAIGWIFWLAWLLQNSPDPARAVGARVCLIAALPLAALGLHAAGAAGRYLPAVTSLSLVGTLWLDQRVLASRFDVSSRWSICAGVVGAVALSGWLMTRRHTLRGNEYRRTAAVMAMQFLIVIGVALWLAYPPSVPARALARRPPRASPNVVLIVLDTVRARNMSVYGYAAKTTPFLDELSRQMTVYRGIASSDMTLSTHGSMFTGLMPTRHGAHVNDEFLDTGWTGFPQLPGQPLSPSARTLAEILAGRGYITASVAANCAYLGPLFGLNRGFDISDAREPAQTETVAPAFLPRSIVFRLLEKTGLVRGPHNVYRTAGEINRDARGVLRRLAGARRPFFLFLNYMDAHSPFMPPAPFDRLFPGKIAGFGMKEQWALDSRVMTGQASVTPEERRHLVSQYDGGIAYIDHHLREFTAWLRDEGLFDDTLLIITSDHGEGFGSRGYVEHAWSVHGELIEVPLMVKRPRQGSGTRSERMATSTDIFATVLDAAGTRIPRGTEGVSLLANEPAAERLALAESFPSPWYVTNKALRRTQRAVQSGSLKLISSSTGEMLFYDKAADPNECHDLSRDPAHEESRKRLEATLSAWVSSAVAPASRNAVPSEETLRILRSLGYIH